MSATARLQNWPGRRPRRILLLLGLALLIPSLCVFAGWVFRYQPALSAAPGYEMRFVTQPSFWDNPGRVWQRIAEQRPCDYQILGWTVDSSLYYQAICGTESRVWRYGPDRVHEQSASAPSSLSRNTFSRTGVLDRVRADGVRPIEQEPVTRPLLLKSEGYVSPDGRWIAIVTQHLYGPQDIVVLVCPVLPLAQARR